MSRIWFMKGLMLAGALAATVLMTGAAHAQLALTLNEIFFDPPGSTDDDEFFEVKGPVSTNIGTAATYDYYVVFLENEALNPGALDLAFELTGSTNASGVKFYPKDDSDNCAASSTPEYVTAIENSGFTVFLLRVEEAGGVDPATVADWDTDNDGEYTDDVNLATNKWVILDSLSVIAEDDETCKAGAVYSPNIFAANVLGPCYKKPAVRNFLVNTNDFIGGSSTSGRGSFTEIEYVGRLNDDGQIWFAANVSEDAACVFEVVGNGDDNDEPECIAQNNTQVPFDLGDPVSTPGSTNVNGENDNNPGASCTCSF